METIDQELSYLRIDVTLQHRFAQDKLYVDFNGHYLQPRQPVLLSEIATDDHERRRWIDLLFSSTSWMLVGLQATKVDGTHDIRGLTEISPGLLDKWMEGEITTRIKIPSHATCYKCGQDLEMSFDGKTIEFIDTSSVFCQITRKDLTHSVELDVDCGELVFGNDFRRLFPPVDHEISIFVTERAYVRDYADHGMFHMFVGNSSPGIFQREDGIIIIASAFYEDEEELKEIEKKHGKRLGSVCTDLWWVSAMDAENFVKSRLASDGRISDIDVTVPVTPGRYKMTVYSDIDHDDEDIVYAKIEPIN